MNAQVRAALTDRSPNRDRSLELALMQVERDLRRSERPDAALRDDATALALRAMNRLDRVLTKRGVAIVYGERHAHPFQERLSVDLVFGLRDELLIALLRPYVRKSAPDVDLPLVACNARRAYELIHTLAAEAAGDPS